MRRVGRTENERERKIAMGRDEKYDKRKRGGSQRR